MREPRRTGYPIHLFDTLLPRVAHRKEDKEWGVSKELRSQLHLYIPHPMGT